MTPRVMTAAAGMRGFDVNQRVEPSVARALALHGYTFAMRYLPRAETHPDDLTSSEIAQILSAGLAVMPVQHVESESSWVPSGDTGAAYGATAARVATAVGFPRGVSVWLDLEGVSEGTAPTAVIAYCQNWYDAVAGAGYLPGLYVGWRCGLGPRDLYERLSFPRYWAAYNLNLDQHPATRGVCMQQRLAAHDDFTAGLDLDVDVVHADALGGLPMLCAPANDTDYTALTENSL